MKKNKHVTLLLGVALVVFGCVSVGSKDPNSEFQVRSHKEEELPNGLKLFYIQDSTLPKMSIGLMVSVGSYGDPAGKLGLNYFTADMLSLGTQHMSATQLSDEFGQIASALHISPSADYTTISASTLSHEGFTLTHLFADAVMAPKFDETEMDRLRSRVLASIAKQADNPSTYADILIDEKNFFNHPYAHPVIGNAESVKSLTRSDLQEQYLKFYRPEKSFLFITGAFDESLLNEIRSLFSAWKPSVIVNSGSAKNKSTEIGSSDSGRYFLYSKPGLQQAQIRFAHRSIKRNDPDFLTLRLINLVLGGDFVSRLNFKVRDQLGLTYSISSSFQPMLEDGSFEISTFTRNEKVKETIHETFLVLKKFVENGITQKELDSAKALMLGQFPSAIETTDKLAVNLMLLKFYGVDDNYLNKFISNVQKISLEDANAAIRRHMFPEKMKVLVYADEKLTREQLSSLELSFGKLEIKEIGSESTR